MVAGGVHEAHSETNGQVEVGLCCWCACIPMAMLKVRAMLLASSPRTNHVKTAGSIVTKRIGTHGGIVDLNRSVEIEQSVIALSCMGAGIAAIRWRADSLRVSDERRTGKREWDENKTASPRQRPAD
jgi:hypothetical protein